MTTLYVNTTKYCRTFLPAIFVKRYGLDDINLVTVDLEDPEFKRLFPYQKVPALVSEDGRQLTEAMALNYFLLRSAKGHDAEIATLLGDNKDTWTQAEIIRWESFSNSDYLNELNNWAKPLVGLQKYDAKTITEGKSRVDTMTPIFEDHFATHRFLVGDDITLADLMAATSFSFGFTFVLDAQWRAEHPAIMRWFKEVVACDILRDFYKDFNFVEVRKAMH